MIFCEPLYDLTGDILDDEPDGTAELHLGDPELK